MFQLPDLSMMYCAIATVSAAVGYRYSRRRRRGEPNRCVYQGPCIHAPQLIESGLSVTHQTVACRRATCPDGGTAP